jgi:hypothetical protein
VLVAQHVHAHTHDAEQVLLLRRVEHDRGARPLVGELLGDRVEAGGDLVPAKLLRRLPGKLDDLPVGRDPDRVDSLRRRRPERTDRELRRHSQTSTARTRANQLR